VGVNNIDAVAKKFGKTGTIPGNELKEYLTNNIDYHFNDEKKEALKMFLDLMSKV
jgi:predicted solute-binding protein